MKRIILIIIISAFTFQSWAQKDLFSSLTSKYADKNGFSASQITSDMFDLYLKKRNIEKDSPVYDALKNLNNILVVSQTSYYSDRTSNSGNNIPDTYVNEIHQDILKYYQNNNYTLFKTEKQMGEEIKVFLKKSRDKIQSLALITNSDRVTNLVELQGENIDLLTVSELNKALNLRGLENLYKINSQNAHGFYVPAPNVNIPAPDVPSEEKIREMVEKQRELIEKQRHLTDEQREKIELQARIMAEKQLEMAEKYREMADKYRRQPIFLNTPGDSVEYYIDGKKVTAEDVKKIGPGNIESVEVNKNEGENNKGSIRITTRK